MTAIPVLGADELGMKKLTERSGTIGGTFNVVVPGTEPGDAGNTGATAKPAVRATNAIAPAILRINGLDAWLA